MTPAIPHGQESWLSALLLARKPWVLLYGMGTVPRSPVNWDHPLLVIGLSSQRGPMGPHLPGTGSGLESLLLSGMSPLR